MAKNSNRASIRPSQAEAGGDIGFPIGSTVEILDAKWGAWEEAGEKAYGGKTGRTAEDPALIITGQVEGQDEPKIVFLGAGKATRLVASSDGEYLDIAEGSSAKAISTSSKANIFNESLVDKKTHGKMTLPEELLDGPISEALIGLKFVVGSKKVDYNFQDQEEGKKAPKPAMIADEILALPGQKKAGKKSSAKPAAADDDDEDEVEVPKKKSKKAPVDDDDDEDEAPAPKKSKGKKGSDDATADAEKAVVALLEDNPKYRKGLPAARAFTAVYSAVKDEDNAEAITDLVQDDKWMQAEDRPWAYDEEAELYTSIAE